WFESVILMIYTIRFPLMHKINKFCPHQHHIFKIILPIILMRAKIKNARAQIAHPNVSIYMQLAV
ncbi:MAG: hypothetical protein IIX55_09515, partial [Muribaculaceae bacterium]|nr:hypothetical protein [Muribaculaceae bacterium]